MSVTKEMLEAVPTRAALRVDEVATAIDACLRCVQACTACTDGDLAEPDVDELRTCIALNQNCADVCDVTARLLSRPAHLDNVVVHRLLQSCVRACTMCAEECAQHAAHHRHCAVCETACRACEQACGVLLNAEAFASL